MMSWRKYLLGAAIFALTAWGGGAAAAGPAAEPVCELAAQSAYQWTGLAVTPDDRIFVSYPRGANQPPFQLAELAGGQPRPILEAAPFISVQSIIADEQGRLWVLDAGQDPTQSAMAAAPRLYCVDLAAEEILQTYSFPAQVILADTYLDDLRLDLGKKAVYLTDSGHGGILVLDLNTGEAWRALTDIPEVRANIGSIYFPHTGMFTQMAHSDGLELSADRRELYFSALGGDCLYAVKTAALLDRTKTVQERREAIRWLNINNLPTDGMVLRDGVLYMGNLADEGLWEFELDLENSKEAGRLLNFKKDFRWASAFSLAPDGTIYFITSAVNYPPEQQPPYELYRIRFPKQKSSY